MVPLGYSLPAYSDEGLRKALLALPLLKEFGFPWIVLTPTYGVRDGARLAFVNALGPSESLLAEVAQTAASMGFNVRLEPHLDWEATLTGKPYEWRRRMFFSPGNPAFGYVETILQPLHRIAASLAARYPSQQFNLTLGSELDVSAAVFSSGETGWATVARELGKAVPLGHKVNHDFFSWGRNLLEAVRSEQKNRALAAWDSGRYRSAAAETRDYLQGLQYVSVSFYPELPTRRTNIWWRDPVSEDDLADLRTVFRDALLRAARPVLSLRGPKFSVGEFGLGSADPGNSWRVDPSSFLSDSGKMDQGARNLRNKFYGGILLALSELGTLFEGQPACFWTVGHFDVLQVLYREGCEAFADDDLAGLVADYLRELRVG